MWRKPLTEKWIYFQPRFSMYRFIGSIAMGNLLSWIIFRGIPDEETIFGISLTWLRFLIPIGSALGVHTVGNIGREEGGFLLPFLGAYLPYLYYSFHDPSIYMSTISAAIFFRYAVHWNRKPPKKTHICKWGLVKSNARLCWSDFIRSWINPDFFKLPRRVAILSTCALIYLALWTSYFYYNVTFTDEHGDQIKFRDSVKNLFKSPLWKEFVNSFKNLLSHYRHHGFQHFWDEVIQFVRVWYLQHFMCNFTLKSIFCICTDDQIAGSPGGE